MRILVTGGTTFVSKYTAEYFVQQGYEVCVLNRNSKSQVAGVTLIEGDRHQLGDKLRRYHFDVVIDVTAYNATDILDLHKSIGSYDKYIFISSSAVYPEYGVQPFTENEELNINKFWGKYGTDKIDAEEELLKLNPNAYILRPPYLYGPMNNVYREAFVFDCAVADRRFFLPRKGEMRLQFFHVKDLCGLMDTIIKTSPEEHIMNVGNKETVTVKDWVKMCYQCMDKEPVFVDVDDSIEQRSYFSFYNYEYYLDVTKQNKIYPDTIPLIDGLKESFEWYKSNIKDVKKKPFIEYIDSELA